MKPRAVKTTKPANPQLTIAAAAEARGVSTRTVRRWIAGGLLPAYRCGPRLVRIDPRDLDQLARPIPTAGGGSNAA
jgi:excisionase family DNA binding protein